MLRRALRQLISFVFGIVLVATVVIGAYKSTQKSLVFPTETEITAIDNVGTLLPHSERKAIIRSRASSVQVMSMNLKSGGISQLSGTYFSYDDKYFVLTANHGVEGPCMFTQIVVGENLYGCKALVLADPQTDYIIIQVDKIAELTPVRIPTDIPSRQERVINLATQNTVYYTGYPNHGGPYTFDGRIVAYSEDEAVFIDSYGWSGSSGAGVFSAQGKLIGWIMALDIGETGFGRQVLENFIWVIPLFEVNWPAVKALAE